MPEDSLFDVVVVDMGSESSDVYDVYEGISVSFMTEELRLDELKYVIAIHFNDSLEEHNIPLTDLPDQIMSCFDLCFISGEWLTFVNSWHRCLRIYIGKHDSSKEHKAEIAELVSQ